MRACVQHCQNTTAAAGGSVDGKGVSSTAIRSALARGLGVDRSLGYNNVSGGSALKLRGGARGTTTKVRRMSLRARVRRTSIEILRQIVHQEICSSCLGASVTLVLRKCVINSHLGKSQGRSFRKRIRLSGAPPYSKRLAFSLRA